MLSCVQYTIVYVFLQGFCFMTFFATAGIYNQSVLYVKRNDFMQKALLTEDENTREYYAEAIQTEKDPSRYLKIIGVIFASVCFSQLRALGNMSPFSVSFLAVIPFEYCFVGFLGSTLGSFIALPWRYALKVTASLFITVLCRVFIHRFFPSSEGGTAGKLSAFFSVLVPGAAFMLFTSVTFTDSLAVLTEAALSLCATVFFIRAIRTPVMNTGIRNLQVKDSVSLVLSLCIFIMCMSGFTVEGVSPARILSAAAVMFMALYKGATAGAVTGVCVGAALCISPDLRHLFPAYALGGLLSGVFAPFGQVGSAAAFALCYCAVCLLNGLSEEIIVSLIEVAVSFAGFLAIPVKYISSLQDLMNKSGLIQDNEVNKQVAAHLKKAANNIYDVSKIVSSVSDKLDSAVNPELNRLFASVQQRVCDGCERKSECWNKSFDATASELLRLSGIEKRPKGRHPLEKNCLRSARLISFAAVSRKEYTDSVATKMKIREMRRILTDQFSGIGDFLNEISDQVSQSRIIDTARSVAVRTAIQDAGVEVDALSYYTDCLGSVSVEIIILDKIYEFDRKKVKTILELMTKRRFENAQMRLAENRTTVTYTEKLPFSVKTGFSQRPLKENTVCGDTVAMTQSSKSTFCALISDGMGTGKRAAVDSVMAASLMEKLLSASFSFDSALKIVNTSLIAKSTDESMATIDGIEVNLYTGQLDFYKAGAAISFVRRGNKVVSVEKSSLPVGIIRNISFSKQSITAQAGDIVLLLSDGVAAEDCGWISDELLSWSTNSMEDLSRHILELASLRKEKGTADDLTVLAVKLVNNK